MKHVLNAAAASLLILFTVQAAAAQSVPEPYSEPVLGLLQDMPVFPTSTAQLNAQLARVTADGHIEVHPSLAELRRRLQERADRTEAAATVAASTPATGSTQAQQELMRQMQDPAFQQRLAQMSQEEQMAFALQMQQTMEGNSSASGGLSQLDLAPTVDQLSRNAHALLLTGVYEPASVESIHVHVERALEQIQGERAAITNWEAAEFDKLPNDAEKGGDKEQTAARALRLASINKQIAVADKHLQALSVHWSAELSRSRQLIDSSDRALAAIGYFDRVSDGGIRGTLMGHQAELLKYVDGLCDALETVVLALGPLQQQRQTIEGS